MRRGLGAAVAMLAFALALGVVYGCGSDSEDTEPTAARTVAVTPTPHTAAASSTAEPAVATETAPPAPEATATARPAATGASITISAVGDVSLARELNARMEANGAGYPYELISHLITGDIAIANLEGALTDRGEPWAKGYTFRTPPKFADGILGGGFDAVSLANNHAMDFGTVGLTDTIAALDGAGVRSFGGGANDAEARRPLVLEANGLRVALIGCARTPTEGGGFSIYDWQAGTGPGLAICEADWLAGSIAAARSQADFVIVVGHIGDEYVNRPSEMQREIVEAVMAAGADAYIGHHAHVVQPVEHRGNQFVAWGLGNFIFDLDEVDLANTPEPRVAPILHLTLTQGAGVTSWDVDAVVLEANEDRPRPATEGEAAVLDGLLGG